MKIIIPMTGKSSRFKNAGVEIPKQFLKIENNFVLDHIVNMFPGEKDINLIVSKSDFQDKTYQQYLSNFKDLKIHTIDFQKSGPGGALIESGILNTDEQVLINYCDFANIWNWTNFKKFIKEEKPDGVVPAYRGIHPHSIYNNDYAFIKNSDNKVLRIREKKSFTENKITEYASTGTYYFKSGNLANKYIRKVFELKNFVNNEVYISTPYEEMVKDSLNVKLYHVDYFFQWGTPEDFNEFNYNLEEVKNVRSKNKIDLTNINLLIPAAGKGQRFRDEGYKGSKINLELNGKKIIENIVNMFHNQETTKILLHKDDQIEKIDQVDDDNILIISERTGGQAESSSILINSIDNSNPILVHSADCILDKKIKIEIEDSDIVVYTKKDYRRAFSQPLNYGWVNMINSHVESFSIKKNPKSKNSTVILGVFLFRDKDLYNSLYFETRKKFDPTKEIHVDHLIETALSRNLKVKIVSSEHSVMIGTPIEYQLYKYMNQAYLYLNKK